MPMGGDEDCDEVCSQNVTAYLFEALFEKPTEEEPGAGDETPPIPSDYSEEQVELGEAVYTEQCVMCHGENGDSPTPLFVKNTEFDSIFDVVLNTMPIGGVEDCDETCSQNVTAYLVERFLDGTPVGKD